MCDARRISARGVSLGVQRHVLDGGLGREHGNGTQECGSTEFLGGWAGDGDGAVKDVGTG